MGPILRTNFMELKSERSGERKVVSATTTNIINTIPTKDLVNKVQEFIIKTWKNPVLELFQLMTS